MRGTVAPSPTETDPPVPLAIRLTAWYLALLVPTLLFKLAYVWTLSAGDLQLLQTGEPGPRAPTWWLLSGHLLPADALDIGLVLAALWLVGHGLLRIAPARLAVASTALGLAAGALSVLALRELGTLLSTDTLAAALNWSTGRPPVTAAFLTPRRLALIAAGSTWLLAPLALTWVLHRVTRRRPGRQRAVVMLLAAGLLFAAVRAPHALLPGGNASALTRGFWRSAALSLVRADGAPPDITHAATVDEVMASYMRLAFPAAASGVPTPWLVEVPPPLRLPRHIVVITLETAPHAFYDLDRPDLPAFRAMRAHGVMGDRHHTTAPMSSMALFSLLSGTYPRAGAPLIRYGHFQADSLPALLGRRGYETTYIDSYDVAWNGPDEAETIRALGFNMVRDSRSDALAPQPDPYSRRIARERHSFDLARSRILHAAREGRHALVTVATHIGHFDWPTRPGAEGQTAREKLADTTQVLDALVGELLGALDRDHLTKDLIVVVTGDHGLRFRAEFESLGEPVRYGDATFHVPLLIYAPALFAAEVRLPHVTSHVDLTPTLLDLTGTPRDSALHHGGNVLDAGLAERITFLPSGDFPGLRPVNGFHWRGVFYGWHDLLDRVTVRRGGEAIEEPLPEVGSGAPLTPAEVRAVIRESRRVFDETAAVFLQRAR